MDENDEVFPVMYVLDPKRLNTIYRLYPNDVSEFNDYDENDDRIHTICSDGYEEYNTYNDKHQVIHRRCNSYGIDNEIDYEYDKYGNCIHEKYNNGYEIFNKFDSHGNYLGSYDNIT